MANTALEKAKAREIISESAHSLLTSKITLPLGNPELKKVHTNQFLWTELPDEFVLENWETIASAYQSKETRYQGSANSGYTVNRWYIESVDITVEAAGKAEMSLGLNAFPSSLSEWTSGYREMMTAYQDTFNKQNNSTSGKTGSGKSTTNATTNNSNSLINEKWVKKYNVPQSVVNAVKKACKGKKTNKDKAYAWYQWMDKHVGWIYYTDHKYSPDQVLKQGNGNCVDNCRVYRLGCLAMGILCKFVQGKSCCSNGECANHQWNMVYLNGEKGKGTTVDCGRQMASWGSHWGKCSSSVVTTKSW